MKGNKSMDATLKTSVWQQFGASIDYLAEMIHVCPDELWRASLWQTGDNPPVLSHFWYVAYHTIFSLDLYLTGTEEDFLPPAPFTPIPERLYTKQELQDYLSACRQKCHATIDGLTEEAAERTCRFEWGELSFLELLIYNLRHLHGHATQLNMLLGQHGIETPDYPTRIEQNGP